MPKKTIQDFTVGVRHIMGLWRENKISHNVCITDLLCAREQSSLKLVEIIQGFQAQELADLIKRESDAVVRLVFSQHSRFRRHATVSAFLEQVEKSKHWGRKDRGKALLLCGESGCGKTSYGIHLIGGPGKALVVNCQGLGVNLPSITDFHKQGYEGIVWDEVSREQVLNNKKIFQSSIHPVELGQSACNQHAYTIWPYLMKNILCSNKFAIMSGQDSSLEREDEDWLQANVMQAHLPPGKCWFLRDDEHDFLFSEREAQAAAQQSLLAAGGG